MNISVKSVKKLITKKTKAIDCVHYGGLPCDMDELQKIYVLRRILNPMGTMDSIEFLLGKLKETKDNADFFQSMNK